MSDITVVLLTLPLILLPIIAIIVACIDDSVWSVVPSTRKLLSLSVASPLPCPRAGCALCCLSSRQQLPSFPPALHQVPYLSPSVRFVHKCSCEQHIVHPPAWEDGRGWYLVNVWAKSRALFLYRLQAQDLRHWSLTAGWLKKWNLRSRTENPPFRDRIPASLEYLRGYIVDTAYIPRQGGSETIKAYKKRLSTPLQTIHNASSTPQEMRITRLWPQSDWQKIWENLTTAPISEADRATWYRAIHDILSQMRGCTGSKCPQQKVARNVARKTLSYTV